MNFEKTVWEDKIIPLLGGLLFGISFIVILYLENIGTQIKIISWSLFSIQIIFSWIYANNLKKSKRDPIVATIFFTLLLLAIMIPSFFEYLNFKLYNNMGSLIFKFNKNEGYLLSISMLLVIPSIIILKKIDYYQDKPMKILQRMFLPLAFSSFIFSNELAFIIKLLFPIK